MKSVSKKFNTVDEYIDELTAPGKGILTEIRKTIRAAAPAAEELISYNMPAFKFHGALVYYAAYKNHIGFYPVSSAIMAFKKELAGYELSKGTIRFPIEEPIPMKLISKIVKFRLAENLKIEQEKVRAKKIVKAKSV